jgi:hypothetical protein
VGPAAVLHRYNGFNNDSVLLLSSFFAQTIPLLGAVRILEIT